MPLENNPEGGITFTEPETSAALEACEAYGVAGVADRLDGLYEVGEAQVVPQVTSGYIVEAIGAAVRERRDIDPEQLVLLDQMATELSDMGWSYALNRKPRLSYPVLLNPLSYMY